MDPFNTNPTAKNQTAFHDSEMPPATGTEPTQDEKLWATLSHLAVFVFAIFGPLIIMLIKKDQSEFIERHAKEALNFQLSVLIVQILSLVTCVGPFIVAIAAIVYAILATLEANKGNDYLYPYTFRMIK